MESVQMSLVLVGHPVLNDDGRCLPILAGFAKNDPFVDFAALSTHSFATYPIMWFVQISRCNVHVQYVSLDR